MDTHIQRELNDKLYDKRKVGALNLERTVREASAADDHDKVKKIIDQLCHDFAYAVHQPHARNGGLIGLAAASIALGPDVAQYLEEIIPPVLACFMDQDARVRYYACESMYNIAKVAKGEILLFFNDVFDALCKLAADSELSVKNGAELLDRLVKDIVSESAATYVSVLNLPKDDEKDDKSDASDESLDLPTAFALPKFIELLKERIFVINPFTRTFLVSWITLLDSIPDLELVFYLPAFLGGLFKFLSDPNRDVHVATQGALERFLAEIKRIARIKRGVEENRKGGTEQKTRRPTSSRSETTNEGSPRKEETGSGDDDGDSVAIDDGPEGSSDEDWIPGQDVHVDHSRILEILVNFLDSTSEEEIQLTALRWIDSFFEICPGDILAFVPRLLSQVLPALANDVEQVRQAAKRVNNSLMDYIVSLSEENKSNPIPAPPSSARAAGKDGSAESTSNARPSSSRDGETKKISENATPPPPYTPSTPPPHTADLDYPAAVNALTLQFLNEHEETRIGALTWLIMLHKKAPRKLLAINEGTFPALLKTLSDASESVVTKDLQLLSQISKNSEDDYFSSFMVNLLQLFCTDRRLLEARGNLIIRQLCDVEFASIMIQNLNNNLITAPELADLRKRLRNLESRDGQTFFVALFRSWCHNGVATFSLCLLAQAYEQAYNLLQILYAIDPEICGRVQADLQSAELEMTVNMLIQIDKLVQLLESPVFTYLRLQLLEPERYPYLYKCLYGVLMLLPQSSAFAALKNRLNSVSAIGYLHIAPRPPAPGPTPSYDRPARLKASPGGRDDSTIKWSELLDKFKSVQERSRRQQHLLAPSDAAPPSSSPVTQPATAALEPPPAAPPGPTRLQVPALAAGQAASASAPATPAGGPTMGHRKSRSGFSRLSGAVAGRKK
ncbi:MAG: hypothetical protein M1833_005050 [Piccolia ochrophora]|nr:MAG: hypothetical protein M1833_005050 [Piccolia ochrophora]